MSFCRGKWLLASGCLLLLARPAVAADASAAIAKLLDVGWSVTPQARAAADLQYQEVVRLAGADLKAIEASWLVLMQQRRFDEALKRLDEHLARDPEDLAALRAKTWALTVLKQYAASFLSAERISTLVAKRPVADETNRFEHDEMIGFLGRLVGYFGGPISDTINQDERKTLEKRFLGRLSDSERTIFEDARNGVLARFIEMTDESTDARQRATAAAKAEQDKALADVQADREKLDARAKELEETRKKLNSEFKSEMDGIDRMDQPLALQQQQLTARGATLNADLANYQSQVFTWEQLAAREKDSVLRQQYLTQASSLSIIAGRIEADLFTLSRTLRGLQTQRAGLQARRSQAKASAASQVDKINRELDELDRRDRRNEGLEKRASRPVSTSSSKVRALSAQATALSTYDAFPLEAAKVKLLESLK
jgi:hypothetical protein